MSANEAYEEKLKIFMEANRIAGEHLTFAERCHSVKEAARAAGVTPKDFIKNICLLAPDGSVVVGIVKGEDRVDLSRVARALRVPEVRVASPEEMLEKTGYPCGGTPSFGYPGRFLVDEKVLRMEAVYTGGGSEFSLVKVRPADLLKGNGGEVVRIRK